MLCNRLTVLSVIEQEANKLLTKERMKRESTQIRDLELMESELASTKAGILAVHCVDDKIVQLPMTFCYKDKNIFLFFEDDNDLFESIQFNTNVTFTIIKDRKVRSSKKSEFKANYKFLSISISGIIKKIEDSKLTEDLKNFYAEKYSGNKIIKEPDFSSINRVVLIDTEEIKAFEETGG